MQSSAPFDYFISVTGDCFSNASGIASILLSGGTPPYTVEWVDPDLGADIVGTNPSIRTNLQVGTYGVRVNDSTLPTNLEFYINIPISDGVCISIDSVSPTYCGDNNGFVVASTDSNYSSTNFYLYNLSDEYVTSGVTNLNEILIENLSAGTYYIVAEDLGGCTGRSSNFIVEKSVDFDYGLYIVPDASCGGNASGKIYVTGQTGTGPYTYVWSNSQTGNTITGLTEGTYSVQVTDSFGCSLTKTAIIEKIDPIGFLNFSSTPPSCFTNDGSITLNISGGTGPYCYSASTGSYGISYDTSFTIENLFAGEYGFLVIDAGLCQLSVETNLFAPEGMTSVEIVGNNSYCSLNGGSISISVIDGQAPYNYTLINPTGGTLSNTSILSNHIFENLSSGTYLVSIEDANSCGKTEEVTILTEATFNISAEVTGTTCNSDNGIVRVERTTGGQLPFNYILDDSISFIGVSTSAITFNNLSSGSHNVKVIDATGCTQTIQFFIPQSSKLDYTLYSTSCGDGSSGTINVLISSGKPPFTYYWSDNVNGNPQSITITGLTADTYTLTIVGSDGCSLTKSIDVSCDRKLVSFELYTMGVDYFQIQSETKYGFSQMYSGGFIDLTSGETNCVINVAEFKIRVSINPIGIVSENIFYTSNSLFDYPSDQLWYNTLLSTLNSITGIGNVIINEDNNQIIIETDEISGTLTGQEISIELIIEYDITCGT